MTKTALISVSDKTNIVNFAKHLIKNNYQIISTGGTYSLLQTNDIPATLVENITGFPEILDGRVKTLHPKIHGGILYRRNHDEKVLQQHNINSIDMVVINLYPFAKVISNPNNNKEQAIENIDIGGPTLIRAAAKNYKWVTTVTDIADYDKIIDELNSSNEISINTNELLAAKAFTNIAWYDKIIADYFQTEIIEEESANSLQFDLDNGKTLRYGENPHQNAKFYQHSSANDSTIAKAKQLHGTELSFNNIIDADCAYQTVKQFLQPACVIVKHANPCGSAISDNIISAYNNAIKADAESAFGGIVAINKEVDSQLANLLATHFFEVIVAPSFSAAALDILRQKPRLRLLTLDFTKEEDSTEIKSVSGGLLVQDKDITNNYSLEIVTTKKPNDATLESLQFANKICKMVKSNAIVIANQNQTIGIGCGQTSRVFALKNAIERAKLAGFNLTDAVIASDAFFPFRDSIDLMAEYKISAVIQPGGSKKDSEVIAACDEHGIAMVFTGTRHFRH